MTWGATERTRGGLDLGALYGVERSFSIDPGELFSMFLLLGRARGGGSVAMGYLS